MQFDDITPRIAAQNFKVLRLAAWLPEEAETSGCRGFQSGRRVGLRVFMRVWLSRSIDYDRRFAVPGDAANFELRRLHLAGQFDLVTFLERDLVCALRTEIREHLSRGGTDNKTVRENVGHFAREGFVMVFVAHRVLLRGWEDRGGPAFSLRRRLQPVDHLRGEIGVDFHRLIVRAFHVVDSVAALEAEMQGLGPPGGSGR